MANRRDIDDLREALKSPAQILWAQLVAQGRCETDAYREAYPTSKNPKIGAAKFRKHPAVQAYLKALRKQVREQLQAREVTMEVDESEPAREQSVYAGYAEKLRFNRDVIFTPVTDLVEYDPSASSGIKVNEAKKHLIQKITIKHGYNKNGDHVSTTCTVEMPCKLRAVAIDNSMQGHDGPGKGGDQGNPMKELYEAMTGAPRLEAAGR